MHTWRDQHEDQHALDADREPQVAVLEQRVEVKSGLVRDEHPGRAADQHGLQRPKGRGETDFDEVKAHRRADVEIGVDVVRIVEAPEKRPGVIRPMPVVERKVEQRKAEHCLDEVVTRDDARETPVSLGHERQNSRRCRSHQS